VEPSALFTYIYTGIADTPPDDHLHLSRMVSTLVLQEELNIVCTQTNYFPYTTAFLCVLAYLYMQHSYYCTTISFVSPHASKDKSKRTKSSYSIRRAHTKLSSFFDNILFPSISKELLLKRDNLSE